MPLKNAQCPVCQGAIFIPDNQITAYCCYCGEKMLVKSALGAVAASGFTAEQQGASILENDIYILRKDVERLIHSSDSDYREVWGKITSRLRSMREKDAQNPIFLLYSAIFAEPSRTRNWKTPSSSGLAPLIGPLYFVYGYPEPMYVLVEERAKRKRMPAFRNADIPKEYEYHYRNATLQEWINAVNDHIFFERIKEFVSTCNNRDLIDEFTSRFTDLVMNSFFMGVRIKNGRLRVVRIFDEKRHGDNGRYAGSGYFGHRGEYGEFFFNDVGINDEFLVSDNIKKYLLPYLQTILSGLFADYLLESLWESADSYAKKQ